MSAVTSAEERAYGFTRHQSTEVLSLSLMRLRAMLVGATGHAADEYRIAHSWVWAELDRRGELAAAGVCQACGSDLSGGHCLDADCAAIS